MLRFVNVVLLNHRKFRHLLELFNTSELDILVIFGFGIYHVFALLELVLARLKLILQLNYLNFHQLLGRNYYILVLNLFSQSVNVKLQLENEFVISL